MVSGQQAEASEGQSEEHSESERRSGICVDRHNRRIGSGEIKVIVALETADLEANWPFVRFKGIADVLGKRDCA
jgi:hypothetical protein